MPLFVHCRKHIKGTFSCTSFASCAALNSCNQRPQEWSCIGSIHGESEQMLWNAPHRRSCNYEPAAYTQIDTGTYIAMPNNAGQASVSIHCWVTRLHFKSQLAKVFDFPKLPATNWSQSRNSEQIVNLAKRQNTRENLLLKLPKHPAYECTIYLLRPLRVLKCCKVWFHIWATTWVWDFALTQNEKYYNQTISRTSDYNFTAA